MVDAGNGNPKRMFAYTLGDVIQLRVNLTHDEHLGTVSVVYGRDGAEDNTITFAGEVEGTTQLENYAQDEHSLPLKESTVLLRMAVDIDHRPGDYHLLNAYYQSEHAMGILETGSAAPPFRIVQSTASSPRFSLELINNSEEEPDY